MFFVLSGEEGVRRRCFGIGICLIDLVNFLWLDFGRFRFFVF